MEDILLWGLHIIRQVQSWSSPALTTFMLGITWLGSAAFYLILLPFIYWCIDEKKGLKLGIAVLISAWINLSLKFFLDQPRPFFPAYDPSLGMIPERLGGLPSGHAQNAMIMWIIIASWIKKKWAFATAGLIILLVSFSRIYMGVHFPTDILGGWIVGGLILSFYFLLKDRLGALLENAGTRAQMISFAAVSFIMILYRPNDAIIMPGALLLGLGAGYILNRRFTEFQSSVSYAEKTSKKILIITARFALGIAVIVISNTALQAIISESRGSSWFLIIYFGIYGLIGMWVSIGAPLLFVSLRLAKKRVET